MTERPRVVILTALDVEYQAMREHLTELSSRPHPAGTLFETGRLRGSTSQVVLALTGSGNTGAAVVAERAIAMFNPHALFFVGIAGALHDDLSLGDIVFATKVYGYHGGYADDRGFHTAPDTWYPPHDMEQHAHHLRRTEQWRVWLPDGIDPRLHLRPVAAGEVVLNSATHPLREQLSHHYADAAAIEMESAGVARAGQFNKALPILTIRGISDLTDGQKYAADAQGHQVKAMAGAAAVAAALIDQVADQSSVAEPEPSALNHQELVDGGRAHGHQHITAYGGFAAGTIGGDIHFHETPPGSTVPAGPFSASPGPSRHLPAASACAQQDGPAWVVLQRPTTVIWRTAERRDANPTEHSTLELHLAPVDPTDRIPVRRLTTLPAELAAAGRNAGLFTVRQALTIAFDDHMAWATSQEHAHSPAGLRVDRLGQRSVWHALPHDDLGEVLDEDDVVTQLARLLELLVSLPLDLLSWYAPTVGLEPVQMVAWGHVRDLPRREACCEFAGVSHVRVSPDEGVSSEHLLRHNQQVADELAARLLTAVRMSHR